MSKQLTLLFLLLCLYGISPLWAGNAWQRVRAKQSPQGVPQIAVAHYLLYTADEAMLRSQAEAQAKEVTAAQMDLPMPDGTFRTFIIKDASLLPAALMQKYPGLAVYSAVAADNPRITAKLDFTMYGFHAMIFDGGNVSFIDPANDMHDGYYTVHYKKDELKQQNRMNCLPLAKGANTQSSSAPSAKTTAGFRRISNGDSLRTYRLAIACDHQYAAAVSGGSIISKANVLSKMVTTMNRVNGVYERELSVSLQFVPNEDTLIFVDAATDPLGDYNDDAATILLKNQVLCDARIGDANYDVGHVFTTGGGGLSQLGVICATGMKAESVTGRATPVGDGFDIDYVAHEMGHELGSQHTFNNNVSGSCGQNAVAMYAYEPGSGSTIMCYAGICNPDNIQPHSDDYFSGSSLDQIQFFISNDGDRCALKTATGNKVINMPAFSAAYTIPYLTPFELTAPAAITQAGDTQTTYCWEQWDLGDFGQTLTDTHEGGPIFRSYAPVATTARVFPTMDMVLAGKLSNAGVNNASGEKVPDVARQLTFRLAVRDMFNGNGSFLIPEDTVALYVINTGTGFKVTSQATDGIVYTGNTGEQITWDVAGTANAPVKAATVDIYMSVDSGRTWAYNLGTVPNSGSATVNIPNPDTSVPAARFKVKGTNNVFFNVNSKYFRVNRNLESALHIYPVPAHDVLHITAENSGQLQVAVYDATGRCQWKGSVTGHADLPLNLWARGVYIVKIIDDSNRRVIKKIVVE